jgi:threonine dehydratase
MQTQSNPFLITVADIRNAQQVIAGKVHRTPMMTAQSLSNQLGVELLLKAELLQKTGSFKPRGALNRLSALTTAERERGVITISAGNHAAGLAYAASFLGVEVTVVMPTTAVRSKVDATRGYGANVILAGEMKDLLPKMEAIQQARGLTYIPPFDDLLVIAGQGTIGLEILADVDAPDVVIVPIGGGGLIAGIAAAIKQSDPALQVIGVEPVGSDVMSRSLAQHSAARLDRHTTIADGLCAPFAGQHTLRHVQTYVDDVVLVSDEAIREAMWLLLERCKLLTEPAGAVSVAALLQARFRFQGI